MDTPVPNVTVYHTLNRWLWEYSELTAD